MRGIFCVAAERVIQDSQSSRMSVINIMEPALVNGLPTVVPELAILALWEREPTEAENYPGRFVVRLDDHELMSSDIEVHFRGTIRNRMTTRIQGLQIEQPGLLSFTHELDNGVTLSYSLEIRLAEDAEVETPTAETETEAAEP